MKKTIVKTAKLWAFIAAMLSTTAIYAEMPKPTISGFIDTTYNYDFNKPVGRVTTNRSFDRRTDSFLLNAIQVNISGNGEEGIGYYGELAFGTDPSNYKSAGTNNPAEAVNSNVAYNFDIQEAFLTYKCPNTGIQLKAGKFVTLQGIEVIESKDNFTISRGIVFGLLEPFTHVGGLVGYQFPQIIDLWVGAVNGWDLHVDNNTGKTLLAKMGINFGEKAFGAVSLSYGSEQANTNNTRTSFDTTWFLKPMDKTTIGLQFNAGQEKNTAVIDANLDGVEDNPVTSRPTAHWYGASIQPKYDLTEKLSIGARYEWLQDLGNARAGTDTGFNGQTLQTASVAPAYNLTESLMFRTEYRHDWGSRLQFIDDVLAVSKSAVSTVHAEFIYKF
ncbi:MAG: hypothetical protein A3I11_08300 [Elusimicrobia bacterium RIFCSPLOWO2_02_FULL_39_32]|nr:MAG: hypothetical protein A2034_07530 [Elusimicrobia bacterium GWA2_38_7]OGR79272.1 MAG: hypothetical protein A3B80_08565 [Elusimicrobia bacterium RIFCSPHIGHO2_02_FULL_39_36]OGR93172.1 MAG: hypothetical protein A3I11_08300 [Elusimicrobia bacterium RIFCSPLOWO2_02_FULL_39_32]OGR99397.1 MAG: hypothetical protein A3G85_06745 [Elusimicrobia bacterium RIFCSPLOWO2_12_FULL_39_28]